MADDTPRKRRRPAKACEQCRQRKVRCDPKLPCGPCMRAKSSLNCSYKDAQPETQRGDYRVPLEPARPREQARNVLTPSSLADGTPNDDLHQAVRDIQARLNSLEKQTCLASRERDNGPGLREELRALTSRLQTLEGQLTTSSHAVFPAQDRYSIGAIPPRVRPSARKAKFLGPTHWCNKMDQLAIAEMLGKSEPDPSLEPLKSNALGTIKECRELRQNIKARRFVRLNEPLPDLRSTVPPREECDELVHCYLRTFESIYRIIQVPSFWTEYEEFWRKEHTNSFTFLIKLVLILAIGTVFHSNKENTTHEEQRLVQKWTFAAQWWLSGPSEKSTVSIDGLQVMCLLLVARKACGLGPSPWLSAGSLMQAAMTMGLHRDPSCFFSLSTLQAEMRRRLWATALELVLLESLDSATPILVPANFDTHAPLNIDDRELSFSVAADSLSSSSDRVTDTSLQILLHDSVKLRMQVLKFIHNSQGYSYQEALNLGDQLCGRCRKSAAFFRSAEGDQGRSLELTEFHANFVNIHLHRLKLALYAPFIVQERNNPQYYFARKVSLESAIILASHAGTPNSPSEIQDDLMRLCIRGKGSFKGPLNLDVISTLGLEIITQMEEDCTSSLNGDRLDSFAEINRNHLIESLQRILSPLHHIVVTGTPSMKRLALLSAVLGQIRAMRKGQDVKRAVYEAIIQSFKDCYEALQMSLESEERQRMNYGTDGQVLEMCDPMLTAGNMDFEDFFDMDLQGLFPSELGGDISSLLG
ncbi:uncharacterized protein BDV14DRAFT_176183 [Aspergillus stella-maris]|uniref:uncharacterized protein n=1 Tax=Aspergillus stella-maris TaxID=1810926 RepID=UPI003CCD2BDC